jgi:hypothetical protein
MNCGIPCGGARLKCSYYLFSNLVNFRQLVSNFQLGYFMGCLRLLAASSIETSY